MNKQVKININGKDYYCDSEILKLIMRNQDKIELLEYNRDKAIEYIDTLYIDEYDGNSYYIKDNTGNDKLGIEDIPNNIKNILRGEDNE